MLEHSSMAPVAAEVKFQGQISDGPSLLWFLFNSFYQCVSSSSGGCWFLKRRDIPVFLSTPLCPAQSPICDH